MDKHILSLRRGNVKSCTHTLSRPHQSLHHQHSPLPHAPHKLVDINRLFFLDPLQHGIQCDECPCPPHPCTTVDKQGPAQVLVVTFLNSSDEGDEGSGKLGDSMVRPRSEVKLGHLQRLVFWFILLWYPWTTQ